jgi:hypothetical protein
MNTKMIAEPCWSTASFGDATEPSPRELSALGEHLALCRGLCGKVFVLQCGAEKMHGFVAARFVTTLVLMVCVIGFSLLVL